jgi:hypothetical protein
MALNPILLFGVITGAIASIIIYLRSKNIKDSIIALVIVFLAFGTPFHFVIVGVYLGSRINHLIFRRWTHNWGAFLVSLVGVIPLFAVWELSMRLIIVAAVSDIDDPGGVIVFGTGIAAILVILMLMGTGFFVISSLYTSFKRRGISNL